MLWEGSSGIVELSSKIRLIARRLQVMLWKLCVMIIAFINNWKRWKKTAESCANDVRSGGWVTMRHKRTLLFNKNSIFFDFFHSFDDDLLSSFTSSLDGPGVEFKWKGEDTGQTMEKNFKRQVMKASKVMINLEKVWTMPQLWFLDLWSPTFASRLWYSIIKLFSRKCKKLFLTNRTSPDCYWFFSLSLCVSIDVNLSRSPINKFVRETQKTNHSTLVLIPLVSLHSLDFYSARVSSAFS